MKSPVLAMFLAITACQASSQFVKSVASSLKKNTRRLANMRSANWSFSFFRSWDFCGLFFVFKSFAFNDIKGERGTNFASRIGQSASWRTGMDYNENLLIMTAPFATKKFPLRDLRSKRNSMYY